MDKKTLIVLGLALVFGGFTAISVNRVLKGKTEANDLGEMGKVVIAVSPISVGEQITPDKVKLEEWPKKILPEGTLDDLTKVVDRVSLAEVAVGELVLNARLAPVGSVAGLPAVIPPGTRAMTVKVDEVIGVAGFVTPNTYVDVIATITRNTLGESTSRIILQHVKVLASGKQIENQKDGAAVEVKTVTLQVMPEQAEALALASNAGKLQLVMRSSIDEEEVETVGVDAGSLFHDQTARRRGRVGGGAAAAPKKPAGVAPPPPPSATVELIQGAERTTLTFQ